MTQKERLRIDEILIEMRRLIESRDPEAAHGAADNLLCEVLRIYGCDDLVNAFDEVPKYYA